MGRKADTHIRVTEETWQDLNTRKGPGDSFEDVIRDLLNADDNSSEIKLENVMQSEGDDAGVDTEPAIEAAQADDSEPGDHLVHLQGEHLSVGDEITVDGEEYVIVRVNDSNEAVAEPNDRPALRDDFDEPTQGDDDPDGDVVVGGDEPEDVRHPNER